VSQDQSDLAEPRARRLSALLREADPPVPPIAFPAERIARAARRRALVRWRVAAAIAVLALAAVGVAPVRAWIVQAAHALWAAAAGTPKPAAIPPAAANPTAGAVTFSPASGSFVLRVARTQAAGTLTVETTDRAVASAAVSGGRGSAELVVLPDGLRIVNDSGATASYVVRVPATIGRIAVGIGPAATRALVPSEPGQRWVLDLRAAR